MILEFLFIKNMYMKYFEKCWEENMNIHVFLLKNVKLHVPRFLNTSLFAYLISTNSCFRYTSSQFFFRLTTLSSLRRYLHKIEKNPYPWYPRCVSNKGNHFEDTSFTISVSFDNTISISDMA